MIQKIKPHLPATLFIVVTFLAVATAIAAGLTGSVPGKVTRDKPNGNGITGSITCEFSSDTLPANRKPTKWWVGTTKYDVGTAPANPITGFPADQTLTVHFSTTAANTTAPAATPVKIIADKTVALQVRYK